MMARSVFDFGCSIFIPSAAFAAGRSALERRVRFAIWTIPR
jgi:hypothetical protein